MDSEETIITQTLLHLDGWILETDLNNSMTGAEYNKVINRDEVLNFYDVAYDYALSYTKLQEFPTITSETEIDGEVIVQELEEGEKILVDPGHIAAMEESVQFDIERVKGAKNIMFGEGLFFTKIEGPGKVWLQTMPITRLAAAIIPYVPKKG